MLNIINEIGLTASFFLVSTALVAGIYFCAWATFQLLRPAPPPETEEERQKRIHYGCN